MSHICAADVQDHEAELEVLVLVQLVNQLSVVSLSQNMLTSNPKEASRKILILKQLETYHVGLFGSFGDCVASLVVVSNKAERRRREGRSCPCFHIYRAKT